jgi:hypothetical protein
VRLPAPRGPHSERLFAHLTGESETIEPAPVLGDVLRDDDVQLTLFVAHEIHYGGIAGVDDEIEWSPELIAFRDPLERAMLEQLRDEVGAPPLVDPSEVGQAVFDLVAADDDDDTGLSRFLAARATLDQFREFVKHRSAYQLKEADPHTFAIPRISGPPKAAMVEIQADEYGGGDPERMHSRLFARTMEELGLETEFGHYLPELPGTTLSTVNLISLFSLRRRWRGALVGHLAGFEISSPGPNRRYANGLRRLGLGERACEFFDEHVEADSVHENIAAFDLAGRLAEREPELAEDIVFGVRSLLLCERLFAGHLVESFKAGRSSMLAAELSARA